MITSSHAQAPESLPAFVVSAAEDSHCSAVTAIACCGDYVCSAGGDAAIRVWRATTLEPVKCGPGADQSGMAGHPC